MNNRQLIEPWGTSESIRDWFDRLDALFSLNTETAEEVAAVVEAVGNTDAERAAAQEAQERAEAEARAKLDSKKVSTVIAMIGAEGYKALKTVAAPAKPSTLSYAELKKRIILHVDPPPTVLGERFKFYRLNQGKKSCYEWRQSLIYDAAFCEFHEEHLRAAIRDQFIFGLKDERVRESLLQEDDVTLEAAYKKAKARENAKEDNKLLSGRGESSVQVNQLGKREKSQGKPTGKPVRGGTTSGGSSSSYGTDGKNVCERCKLPTKSNKCTPSQCKTECFKCGTVGHTRGKCFKNVRKAVHNIEEGDNFYPDHILNHVQSDCNLIRSDKKPIVVVEVETRNVRFELDTGSALTVVSDNLFNKLFSDRETGLKPADTRIRVANGSTVENVRICHVSVEFEGTRYRRVPLHVVGGPFPALLGRDWITRFWGDDWIGKLLGGKVQTDGKTEPRRAVQTSQVEEIHAGKVTRSGYTETSSGVQKEGVSSEEYVMRFDSLSYNLTPYCSPRSRDPSPSQIPVKRSSSCRESKQRGLAQAVQVEGGINCNSSNSIQSEKLVEERLAVIRQSRVFEPGIGEVEGYEAALQLKEDHKPVFRKARSVPFVLKDKIGLSLEKMKKEEILTQVDHSEYASPIVPVEKDDGTVRICGDYKSTLNPNLETKQYPLPTVEDCFQPMVGGEKFTRLDIRQAYNNLRLRECDRALTTINTSQGLFVWNRLPYGVSSSTAIFQQTMDQVLHGLKGVACRVDDILLTGRDDREHLDILEEVVRRLETANFRCNLKKTKFLRDSVTYLGYRVDKHGIRPLKSKVDTLIKASYPENLNSLVSFLGAVNYYGRFIRNLSTVVEPLNKLRRGVPWKFGKEERTAFDSLKTALSSSQVIVPYDPELPVKIDTDASSSGLGAVISHIMSDGTERPIEFASRTLNPAERNYSQIEKEALGIVWGVKRFHKYIYARKFRLVTDHRPLVFILKENRSIPEMGASRILRWAITLSSYQYTIEYRSTTKHANADVCSRFPLRSVEEEQEESSDESGSRRVAEIFYSNFIDKPLINCISICKFTAKDAVLSKVLRLVLSGWPERLDKGLDYLKPYFHRKNELSAEKGCIVWGTRVVVPERLREEVLKLLHVTHQGITAVKAMARSFVWWPGIDKEIELVSRKCAACQDSQRRPPKATPHPWIHATHPWDRIHADFCGPTDGRMWLVVVDAYTKWIEVIDMRSCTTSASLIKELRKLFATFGLPHTFVSDNGPQLISEETTLFLESNGIMPVPVPKYTPICNGLAERAVQSFKTALEKAQRADKNFDFNLAKWLLHQRNTPHATTHETPAMRMFGRPTRTLLSLLDPLTNPTRSRKPKLNAGPFKLRSFKVGEKVRVLDVRADEWYPGVIEDREGSKVYLVNTKAGIERRHVDHLAAAIDLPDIELSGHSPKERPVQKPVESQVVEHAHAEPPRIDIRVENPQPEVPVFPSKQPIVELTKKPKLADPVPSPQPPAESEPLRRSARMKSSVDRFGYTQLGGSN